MALRFLSFNMPLWMETTKYISNDSGKVLWHQLDWKFCFSTVVFISAKNTTFPFSCLIQATEKHNDAVWSRWLLQCNVNICVLPPALISVLSMHSIFGSFSSDYCLHATLPVYAICGNPSLDAFLFPWRMGLFCTLAFSKRHPLKVPLTYFSVFDNMIPSWVS